MKVKKLREIIREYNDDQEVYVGFYNYDTNKLYFDNLIENIGIENEEGKHLLLQIDINNECTSS